jgi:hypothetical protein
MRGSAGYGDGDGERRPLAECCAARDGGEATARKARRIVIPLSDMRECTHLHRDPCLISSLSLFHLPSSSSSYPPHSPPKNSFSFLSLLIRTC